mgnify:CR=1 FL=1
MPIGDRCGSRLLTTLKVIEGRGRPLLRFYLKTTLFD